jgi:hypothetical protein
MNIKDTMIIFIEMKVRREGKKHIMFLVFLQVDKSLF